MMMMMMMLIPQKHRKCVIISDFEVAITEHQVIKLILQRIFE